MSLINLCCVFNATKLTIQTVVHGPYVVQTWPQNGPRVLAHLRDWSGSVSSWNNRCFLQRTCFGPAEFLNMVPNLSQINSNVWMKYLSCPNVSSDFPACSHPAAVFISQGEERRSRAGECGGNRSAAVASLPSTWPWNPIWELMKCLSMPDGQRRRVFAFLINQSLSLPRPPPSPSIPLLMLQSKPADSTSQWTFIYQRLICIQSRSSVRVWRVQRQLMVHRSHSLQWSTKRSGVELRKVRLTLFY